MAAASQGFTKDWEVRSLLRLAGRGRGGGGGSNMAAGTAGGAGTAMSGGGDADNSLFLTELGSSLKTHIGGIPAVPMRVFKRISFKRKREDSASGSGGTSGSTSGGGGEAEGGADQPLRDWEVRATAAKMAPSGVASRAVSMTSAEGLDILGVGILFLRKR